MGTGPIGSKPHFIKCGFPSPAHFIKSAEQISPILSPFSPSKSPLLRSSALNKTSSSDPRDAAVESRSIWRSVSGALCQPSVFKNPPHRTARLCALRSCILLANNLPRTLTLESDLLPRGLKCVVPSRGVRRRYGEWVEIACRLTRASLDARFSSRTIDPPWASSPAAAPAAPADSSSNGTASIIPYSAFSRIGKIATTLCPKIW